MGVGKPYKLDIYAKKTAQISKIGVIIQDLASEIDNKMKINQEREYKMIDGVLNHVSGR